VSEPKFHNLHYNFVAKRLRNHYPTELSDDSAAVRLVGLGIRETIQEIAIEFAQRFYEDNPTNFDPYEFLDRCSPNPDLWPFSVLWGQFDAFEDKEEA
jgi:hypothetical protein